MNTKTKDLTFIAIVLSLGVILKLISDLVTRTFLFVFLIDPFLLISVFLLIKYPKIKVALSIAVIQTIFSMSLFMATDIWAVRPLIVLICYLSVKVINRTKFSINKKYMFACFISAMLMVVMMSIILMGIIFIFPDFFPVEEIEAQMNILSESMNISEEGILMIEENLITLIVISIILMGSIFSFIPAFAHLFLAYLISKIYKFKEKTF